MSIIDVVGFTGLNLSDFWKTKETNRKPANARKCHNLSANGLVEFCNNIDFSAVLDLMILIAPLVCAELAQ